MLEVGVKGFVDEVRAFCTAVERAGSVELTERLRVMRARLLALYACGTALPMVDWPEGTEAVTVEPPTSWPGMGRHDTYYEVFDPYVDDKPVAGSLSDDVFEVYCDVRRGLVHWDRGERAAAVWEWRFHFDAHWGAHAIDALRALHHACKPA